MNRLLVPAALLALLGAGPAPAEEKLPPEIQAVAIDQRLGEQVPLDLEFQDSTGGIVVTGQYFTDKPVLLVLAYYRCPRLCSRVLNELVNTMRAMSLRPGRDYTVVTVSFDPEETPDLAAAKRQAYLDAYGVQTDGWHFLTGKEPNIRRLADAVGFRYVWDAKSNQYQHSTAIMVLTPRGVVSRYFFGIDYRPRDVQLGLVEASDNAIGTPVDQVLLLTCMAYNPSTGKYTVAAFKLMRTAAALTVLVLGGYLAWIWRRERRGTPVRH
jgi:protein SCO1/2